ncbi:hypothetical protein HN51_031141 [Arachis hypogaea]
MGGIIFKLDIRTKLCLRDSLYRLAKSVEQRHNDSIANGCTGDDQACKSMVPYNGSRPHDQSMSHPYDTIPFKSSATIHGSLNSPVKIEKHVYLEDSSTRMRKKTVGVVITPPLLQKLLWHAEETQRS